jgi:hypothetical protein
LKGDSFDHTLNFIQMKTTFLMAATAILLLLSCQKWTRTSPDDKTINLTAPSGQPIAQSLNSLSQRTAHVLARTYNTKEDVTITRIDYLPVQKGFAATVYFTLSDGQAGSFGLLSADHAKGLQTQFPLMTAHEQELQEASAATYMLVCRGSCPCKATLSYSSSSGLSGDCGCNNCSGTLYVSF